ncbi:MAG: FHA domain-containing protein [Nakamurella sp.]
MPQADPDFSAQTTSIFAAGLISADPRPESESVETVADPLAGVGGVADGTALLVVKRGPNAGSRYVLKADVVTAGRHPDSDIFLDDVSVSRRHAEFRRTASGFEVVDVGSLNGTYVNRETIDSSELSGGDEIQIGKFRLVYVTGRASEDSAASAAAESAAGAGPAIGR